MGTPRFCGAPIMCASIPEKRNVRTMAANEDRKAPDATAHRPTLRVIDALETLSRHPEGCTLTVLSQAIDVSPSTLLPILKTLASRHFIAVDPLTGAYTIGIRAFSVGSAFVENESIVSELRSEMEDVVALCQETCQLGVLDGGDVFYIAKVDSSQAIRLISSIGRRVPAYCTALGKALLSDYDDEKIHSLFKEPFVRYTNKTLTSADELCRAIREQAVEGIFREDEESRESVVCYSVPLRQHGAIVAATSISVPKFRLSEEKESLVIGALRSYQERASKILESYPDCDGLLLG